MLLLISCNNDKIVSDTVATESNDKYFVAKTESYSPQTKTSLDNGRVLWKTGDLVSVFEANTANDQYRISDESNGQTTGTLNKISSGISGTSITDNVAYYPYSSSNAIESDGADGYILTVSLPSTQNYSENSFGNGDFPMAAVTDAIDINFSFKNVLGGLKLQLKGTATVNKITITGNNNEILYGAATVTASKSTAPVISLSNASAKMVILDCGAGVTLNTETATNFVIALPPMSMTGGFTIDIYDTGSGHQQLKTTRTQTISRSNLLVMPAIVYEPILVSSAVDLGLSVKWATFNVGATAPEEYGDYYAWGEVDTYYQEGYSQENPLSHWKDGKHSGYSWCNYKYCEGTGNKLTKYCNKSNYGYESFTDTKTSLDLEDDVAHVNWGGGWRIPTKAEFDELLDSDNCNWEWIVQNGVDGFKVTSKKSGYEGVSVFLPAAGYRYDATFYGAGILGHYWSKTLDESNPSNASYLYFFNDTGDHITANNYRHFWRTIRPVCP